MLSRKTDIGLFAFILWTIGAFGGSMAAANAGHDGSSDTGAWAQRPLGKAAWKGHTLAVTERQRVLFVHGRDVTIYDSEGAAERLRSVLPLEITPGTAAVAGPDHSIFLADAEGEIYRVSTTDWRSSPLPSLTPAPGLRLAVDLEGTLYAASGARRDNFMAWREGRWQSLADVKLINRLGAYSAGLLPASGGFAAFGDHHLGHYDRTADRWVKLVGVLGLRPALGRGGMSASHPGTGDLYLTLGKGSNALGCAFMRHGQPASDNRWRFRHLSPRLPIGIDDSGETLFITRQSDVDLLNLVSPSQALWLSIPVADLQRHRGWTGDAADWQWRAGGELVREKDSITNMVHVPPHVYVQRKNVIRRFDLETMRYSKNTAGFRYGRRFIRAGSAAVSDGARRIFVCTGHDRRFYSLHLRERTGGGANDDNALLEIEDMSTTEVAPLPEPLSGNTALAWSGGKIFALMNAESRKIHRYDPEADLWSEVTSLPARLPYTTDLGTDLLSVGHRLLVLSGDRAAWLDLRAHAWEMLPRLAFSFSSDGGMALADEKEKKVYVVLGGGSRDLGILSLEDGSSSRWRDSFPDRVSVHGHRTWIAVAEGQRYLYVFRGHDSNELWRHRLPLPEASSALHPR